MSVAFPLSEWKLCVWKAQATLKQETTPMSPPINHKADLEELVLIVTMSPACTLQSFIRMDWNVPRQGPGSGTLCLQHFHYIEIYWVCSWFLFLFYILILCSAAFPNVSCLILIPVSSEIKLWFPVLYSGPVLTDTQPVVTFPANVFTWHRSCSVRGGLPSADTFGQPLWGWGCCTLNLRATI